MNVQGSKCSQRDEAGTERTTHSPRTARDCLHTGSAGGSGAGTGRAGLGRDGDGDGHSRGVVQCLSDGHGLEVE